jgi:hypothetical protein
MRRRRPTLDVGVLTYLDRDALDEPAATLVCGTTPLRIELRGQRVLLEYQEPVAAHLSELTAGSRGMRR